MTREEELIKRYFDAFNQHDIEGVMACFHEHPVIVDPTGKRLEGRDVVHVGLLKTEMETVSSRS